MYAQVCSSEEKNRCFIYIKKIRDIYTRVVSTIDYELWPKQFSFIIRLCMWDRYSYFDAIIYCSFNWAKR